MSRMHNLLQNLANSGKTLGVIESMTGGLFAEKATEIPGASNVFKGGLVTYSREVKEKILAIKPELIDEEGVVSELVAQQMAAKGREVLGVDVALSITGNAGPTAEPGEAEIGQVYLGLATEDGTWSFGYKLEGERQEIREKAVELMITFGLSQAA